MSNEKPPIDSIRQNVLSAIESGQIKMRSKWKYITSTALLMVGVLLIALSLLYLASFIVFILRATGVLFEPGFGLMGLGLFFSSLPWILIILSLIFIFLLQIMIKRYAFVYGSPLLYSVLGILIIVIAGGISLGYSSLHQKLLQGENHLPFAGYFYQQFNKRPDNLTFGVISQITDTGYKIQDPKMGEMEVVISPQTQIPPDKLTVGESILILGKKDGSVIKADNIRKLDQLPPPLEDDQKPARMNAPDINQ